MTVEFCTGCGASLQSIHPGLPGYIPEEIRGREDILCRRCFRIRHYNEVDPVAIPEKEYIRFLQQLGGKRALILLVVDLFDFEGSWIQNLERYIGGNPLLLVANKVDLLPRQTNLAKVEQWLQAELAKKRLAAEKILLISARKGNGVEKVKTYLEGYANERDIYVVGTTNVGKSTLINQLLLLFGQKRDVSLTTSRYPGTTVANVEMALPSYHYKVIDTPGIMTTTRLSDRVSPSSLKIITPDQEIHPRVYQLDSKQTIFVGGIARIDYVSGERQSFVCYFANQLRLHRTKLGHADELYARHVGEMLQPPRGEDPPELYDLVKHPFSLRPGSALDLVIAGLGWVSLRGQGAEVCVHVPRGIAVTVRRAII